MKKLLIASMLLVLLVSCGGKSTTGEDLNKGSQSSSMVVKDKSTEVMVKVDGVDISGNYKGDMVDGVPNGFGSFSYDNSMGSWEYEGEFIDGVLQPVSGVELDKVYTTPEEYKGSFVTLVGKVFAEVEYVDNGVYAQIMSDFDNFGKCSVLYIPDTSVKLSKGDYVKVSGCVMGEFTGKNVFGG